MQAALAIALATVTAATLAAPTLGLLPALAVGIAGLAWLAL